MEHLVTAQPAAAAPDQTEVAASIPRSSRDPEQRRRRTPASRIQELREAIESGEYRVSASDLADALIRALRRSN